MRESAHQLGSTRSGMRFPFSRLEEYAPNGESLEVLPEPGAKRTVRPGALLWERFADFLPFASPDPDCSLGEGNTPLLPAPPLLAYITGAQGMLIKNETQNPTWSFKDRGSLTCVWMARAMGEEVTATVSTGNMGHSLPASAAHAGLRALVFAPLYTPAEKLQAIAMHGATVLRIDHPDYARAKHAVLALAGTLGLRIVSGNGPIRVEGYTMTAFELVEQMQGEVPDWIAVPTSACGHARGIFKGYRELHEAGIIPGLPRMIIVQAANNSPIAAAIMEGRDHLIPVTDVQTIAEAITSGDPPGGNELIDKARTFGWLAEVAREEEILEGQRQLAAAGFFVEPSAATVIPAIRKLVRAGRIHPEARVVVVLTGSGLKDMAVIRRHTVDVRTTTIDRLPSDTERLLHTWHSP